MAGNQVRIVAVLDDKVSRPLAGIRNQFDTVSKSKGYQSVIQGFGIGAGVGAYGLLSSAISTTVGIVSDSIKAASDLNETMSKSNVVFGSSASQVDHWGGTMAKAFGLSKTSSVEAAATFGNLFNQIGIAPPKVAAMSEKLVELAGDLASFNNIDPTVALEKLRSGLSGEAEPLRTVGVFLTEAKVKAKAMEMGLADAHGELSEGAKIQARYALILKETASAQGDFARTSTGMADQQRILSAELENTSAKLGSALIPGVLGAQKAMLGLIGTTDALTDINNKDIDVRQQQIDSAGDLLQALGFLNPALGGLGQQAQKMNKDFTDSGKAFDDTGLAANAFEARYAATSDSIVAATRPMTGAITDWRDKFGNSASAIIRSGDKITSALAADAQGLINDYFDPIEEHIANNETHWKTLADIQTRTSAKGANAIADANAAIIGDIDDQATALVKLGDKHKLTKADVDRFAKDTTAAYTAMGLKVPPQVQAIINRLRILDGEHPKPKVDTSSIDHAKERAKKLHEELNNLPDRTNIKVILSILQRAAGRGALEAEGKVGLIKHAGGDIGMTRGPMWSPDGGIMGEAGTEAYAILRNPRRIATGDVGGGGTSLTVNFNSVWPPTPAQAREVAQLLDETNYRKLRRAAATAGRV